MALEFPYTGRITAADLVANAPGQERQQDPYFAGGAQRQVTPYDEQYSRLGWFTAGSATALAGLYGAQRLGYKPLDYIYSGVRAVEDFSPAQMFRTFGVGDFLSQYTTQNVGRRYIGPDQVASILRENQEWMYDLVQRSGTGTFAANLHGLEFKDGKLFAGGNLLLENARIMTSSGTPNLAAGYSRALGNERLPQVPDSKKLQVPITFTDAAGKINEEVFYFTGTSPLDAKKGGLGGRLLGGSTRRRAAFNQAHGVLTEWVQRANRLAESPFEMEPFATGTGKLRFAIQGATGLDPTLAVKSGAALPTLGRMAWKWGVLGTGAYLGYRTLDYAARQSELLDSTPLAEGITPALAGVGIQANLAASSIADAIPGLRGFQEWQEEVAPGSTSLTKLAALPLVGALAGLSGSYVTTAMDRINITREIMLADQTLTFSQALAKADPKVHEAAAQFSSEAFDWLTRGKLKGKKLPFLGSFGKTKSFALMGAAAGAALTLPFVAGALIPEYTREKLESLYSGETEVAVRKGRWWEFGRSSYEGGRIEYFRPHWYPRMLQRSYEKSLGIDNISPIEQWWRENFTYEMEKEHYFDRPYPVTGTAFEDIPIIGPVLGATLGQIVKPTKLMHTEEWMVGSGEYGEGTAVRRLPGRAGNELIPGEGTAAPGTPVLPTDLKQVLGEQSYRLTELSGLVGFTLSSIKAAVTGADEWWDQEERLQSARRMYGAEREYWDLSLGGGLGTTEFFRRLYPHRRRQIEEYNPIRNTMPTWLPGPGDKSPDFLHGDPFTKVKEGEIRLPGAGFAARYSELEGVDPEDYSAAYRYAILSDIAPYSDKTTEAEIQVRAAMKRGELSEREEALFAESKRKMQEAKKSRKSFYEYEYYGGAQDYTLPGGDGALQSASVLAELNRNTQAKQEDPGLLKSLVGGYWETLIKGAQNPLEALTPLAPASKLMHLQSAIEDYKRTQVYGPDIAFWDSPVENFILPFLRESADLVGMAGIPHSEKKKRAIQEYFDILEYEKATRLGEMAREKGEYQAAQAYETAAGETLTGLNPYARNFRAIFRSLPRAQRDYFNSFSSAKNAEQRQRILELVPENQKRLYQAQWELAYTDELKRQLDKGEISEELVGVAEAELSRLYEKRRTEGYTVTPELEERFEEEREYGQDYGDWFRENILIPGATEEMGLPGPDWVGWHPGVNLDEVKLKVVEAEGLDIHDFDLWNSNQRAAAHKEYLNEAAEELMEVQTTGDNKSPEQIQAEVNRVLADLGILGQVHVYGVESDRDENTYRVQLDVSEVRNEEVREILREMEV